MDTPFRLGEWQVRPELDRISGPAGDVHVQPLAMRVLLQLVRQAPHVVTKEQLFDDAWEGAIVSDGALTFVIWELRKALGDDAKQPRFIETVPKRGYRFVGSPRFEGDPPGKPDEATPPFARRHGRALLAGALGLVLAVGLFGALLVRERHKLAVRFNARDWVLVADFENRTGEALFDGSLDYALQRELTRSAFVNVAPGERVNDTLRLMRRPPETPVDAVLGREIALRDGAIKAVLIGHIDGDARGYQVGLRVVDPASGATVANPSVSARGRAEVLGSFRQLSDEVRRVLGEDLGAHPESHASLPMVTTRSLRALQFFARAMDFADEDRWSEALELLERAVEQDPEFASAQIFLAHAYSNLRRPEARPHYEKALALADGVSDRERYFILGSYHARYLKDDEKAVHAFEILTRMYPDDYWTAYKLANAYNRLGRHHEATAFRLRAADIRPNSFWDNSSAVLHLMRYGTGWVTRTRYFQRATALLTPEIVARMPEDVAELEFIPAADHWFHGDMPGTLAAVERMARSARSHDGPVQRYLVEYVGRAYLSLGMIREAESRFRAVPDQDRRNYLMAQIALARGDHTSLARHVSAVDLVGHLRSYGLDASALILSGDTAMLSRARAERVTHALAALQSKPLAQPLRGFVGEFSVAARGELLLARGEIDDAVTWLERAVDQLRSHPRPVFFLAAESLANAWERKGNRERALQVLDEAARCRRRAFDDGLFRMRVQRRIAELNRSLGREPEARDVEGELRRLLMYADPDHVILRGLDRFSTSKKKLTGS